MRTKYFIYTPRNFANEYTAIKTNNLEEESKLNEWYYKKAPEQSRLDRVTCKELRKLASQEHHARKYDQSFSGYCNPDNPVNVNEFLCYEY